MIILGFDPGLATLGYGVIKKEERKKAEMIDYGIISTPKEENLAVRLCLLEKGIKQVIDTFRPDEIAVEELFFAKNVKTGIAVAHASRKIRMRWARNIAQVIVIARMLRCVADHKCQWRTAEHAVYDTC